MHFFHVLNQNKRLLALLCMILGCAFASLAASEEDTSAQIEAGSESQNLTEGRLDWIPKTAVMKFVMDLDIQAGNRLGAASRTDELVKEHILEQAPISLLPVLIDSGTRIEDFFINKPGFLPLMIETFHSTANYLSHPSKNLKQLEVEVKIDLKWIYPILLQNMEASAALEKVFTWQPSKDYSGIIIFMNEELDWYGTDEKTYVTPAFLIRLHDSAGRTFFDVSNMEPSMAKKWGPAAYAPSVEAAKKNPRIGKNPLILSAQAVYGKYPVDPVISAEDANLLLFNASTRKALMEGRIIIITPQSKLQENLISRDSKRL